MEQTEGDEDIAETSSEEEEENEKIMDGKVRKLILEVETNPFQYDKHIELITTLRAAGDLDQLRQARESMSAVYPLSEELWLDWFEDELPLSSIPEHKKFIKSKFEVAVKDYASVKVWHEYCQYMMNNIDSPSDIEFARNVFEQAITAVGLHVTEGSSIWLGYREFEIAILDSYQQLQDSGDTIGMDAKVESQIERIAAIYKRQLSIPLLGLDETYSSFEDWYSDDIPDETNRMYDRASQKLSLLTEYEEKLLHAEGNKLAEYTNYINYEISSGDPARIQSIFERAIKDNCLQADLWEKYTNYLDFKLKIPSIAVQVHERAVRNCPWVSKLWQNYLKALERSNVDSNTYINIFEKSMKGGFEGADSYLQIWLIRCDYHRRRILNWKFEDDRVEELHKSFESGVKYMDHYFGLQGDKYCQLLREWAFIEAKYLQNVKRAQELWDTVIKKHSRDAAMWLEYAHFLMLFTDALTVRRLFQRAVQITMEQPEVICDAFMKFERRYGNLSEVDDAQIKIDVQMKKVKDRCEKDAMKDAFSDNRKKGNQKFVKFVKGADEHGKKKKKKKQEKGKNSLKRNNEANLEMEPESKKKFSEQDSENLICMERSTFPLVPLTSYLDRSESQEVKSMPGTFQENHNLNGHRRNEEAVAPGTDEELTPLTSSMLIDQDSKKENLKENCDTRDEKNEDSIDASDKVDDEKSVFLSNLLFTVEESHIREMFSPCGEIEKVHVVFNKAGKSKGFAYLQFKEKESIFKALKLDRETILGRPVFVSECVNKKVNPTQFKFSTSLDKHTVFVTNLPFELNSDEVKEHFAQAGEIKQVRLVTNRSGKSKGFAYVEYLSESAAASAILKLDKQVLKGRNINVSLSNPPSRKNTDHPLQQPKKKAPDIPLGSRGKSKTQISLVPRALNKVITPENSSADTESKTAVSHSTETKSSAMSNSDFRKFLLK